jgi:HPt (histidine-containing phosphotransfer) domain-containing protein
MEDRSVRDLEVETIYGVDYRLNRAYLKPASHADPKKQEMRMRVAQLWERAKPNILGQLSQIETATQALLTAFLDEPTQKIAERQAHKLAGSLGMYGLPQGSELAKKIETILASDLSVVREQMHHLARLVAELHLLVERTTTESLQAGDRQKSIALGDAKSS